jgi:hypothetical protein
MFPPARVSASVALALLWAAPGLVAEDLPAVPRFAISPSPIGLRNDVRPRQYLGVVGRRSAWLGQETGEAELWVHPLKLATRFHIDFRIPEYDEPVRGADVARTVEVRPELTTITYSHATFTVRQHILAPLAEPGLLVLLEVDSYRPLELVVSFRAALQLAWPAALGGQYAHWDEAKKAFLLSESLRRSNAFIGSPWASSGSSHPAHALPDAPSTFTIKLDPARAAREMVPIAIAAGTAPRDEVWAAYTRLLGGAERLYRERREHADRLLASTASIATPDPRLDLAFAWSKVNLDEQTVCNPDLGCGLVAGWGPSGESARPGFGWFFGGDAAINSLAMSSLGMSAPVAEGLRFLAKHQREDGKIPHEISQSAARIPWFSDFPYAYYHADTTPFWLLALAQHWRGTGDDALLAELWPAVQRAWAWCLSVDTDGDGLIENTTGGLGAIEVGAIGEDIHEDVYLASVWTSAASAVGQMASARGDATLSRSAQALAQRALATLNERYWLPEAGHHAFGILKSGKTNDTLTVWPATAAAFRLLETDRASRTLAKLAGHELTADWGARMLTTKSPLYDPTHYNMGAVWPFVTGFVAWGHYNYGRPWSGYPLVQALASTTLDWARGRNPELLSGAYYRPLDEAVPHQFFATSMFATSVLSGVFGWRPFTPGRASLRPQLPPDWPEAKVMGLRSGPSTLQVTFRQSPGRVEARLRGAGPSLELSLDLLVPPGARPSRLSVDGQTRAPGMLVTPAGLGASTMLPIGPRETVVVLEWQGGLALEAPRVDLQPGQRDQGLRVIDFRAIDDGWTLAVEGLPGLEYEVTLRGERPTRAEGAEFLPANGDDAVTRLRLLFPEGAAPERTVRLLR